MKKYRYQCRSCNAHGRWRTNPNEAHADGERHYDKHEHGHECDLFDQEGKNAGPCQ